MKREPIALSEHFDYKKLFRFVLPSVVMAVFTQVYGVVDGLFVSNFVGKATFASVNLMMPVLIILGAIGLMFGTGGSALISKTLGEGDRERANGYFSLFIVAIVISGLALTAIGFLCLDPIVRTFGVSEETEAGCRVYAGVQFASLTALMLQYAFQSFFITAEKSKIGLAVTVASGAVNIALDALFIAGFRWGVFGAALATALGQAVGGIVPLVYFLRKNSSLLRLGKPVCDGKAVLRACANGSSELLTNISTSLVNILYNAQLLKAAGEDGVAAYGVIMYVGFVFIGIFFGYAMGVAPVVGFHYGAQNQAELKNLFEKSLVVQAVVGVVLTVLAEALSLPLARLFVGYDKGLEEMTCHGLRLYSVAFVIMGFNVFASSFFTALNNGAVSASISFLRTLLFQCGAVLLLPLIWGLNGIWLSVVAAEILSLVVSAGFFIGMRKKYRY